MIRFIKQACQVLAFAIVSSALYAAPTLLQLHYFYHAAALERQTANANIAATPASAPQQDDLPAETAEPGPTSAAPVAVVEKIALTLWSVPGCGPCEAFKKHATEDPTLRAYLEDYEVTEKILYNRTVPIFELESGQQKQGYGSPHELMRWQQRHRKDLR